ncbi:MAG TPA: CDGSH iron-sulfur domain-containing protein [Gemmatimonadales bacterium]|jgi:CDGSH-type Zn-finger protein|nr:CDGSH iron-sulfur domain-containing protein [Gemmatimonadales bacterium]
MSEHASDNGDRRGVVITWKPKGPLVVEGPVVVRDRDGNELTPPPAKVPGQVKFCGCGHSANKPFCDGSHKRQLFPDAKPGENSP